MRPTADKITDTASPVAPRRRTPGFRRRSCSAAAIGDSAYSLAGAVVLAIGIGIQNLPEGLAVASALAKVHPVP